MRPATDTVPRNSANMLGLSFRAEAHRLPWTGPIYDVHTHLNDLPATRLFFEAADAFGVKKVWSMSRLEIVDELRDAFPGRLGFIAVPNYMAKDRPDTFTTDWLTRIEGFAKKGSRVCKFWAAPRGRDFHETLTVGSPMRRQAMLVAREHGMMFMTHVGDPDTWFATTYRDASRYGTKASHYALLRRELDEFGDVPWIAAHMAGDPEHLDHVQRLLDEYPHLHLDCSATKWMVRELSKKPDELGDFLRRNPGRVLFGSDIVAQQADMTFDLYASRYWALRTMLETSYDGPSPIVDPDLSMVDPELPSDSTATLRGCALDPTTLLSLYHDAAMNLIERWTKRQ